jgi:hypothetical protein
MSITSLSPQQLRSAADLKEHIDALQDQLNAILGGQTPAPVTVTVPEAPRNGRRRKRRKKVSAEGRANIAAAARARWAARKMGRVMAPAPDQPLEKPKRRRSAAWSKALSEAMRARWAKAKREGKSSL